MQCISQLLYIADAMGSLKLKKSRYANLSNIVTMIAANVTLVPQALSEPRRHESTASHLYSKMPTHLAVCWPTLFRIIWTHLGWRIHGWGWPAYPTHEQHIKLSHSQHQSGHNQGRVGWSGTRTQRFTPLRNDAVLGEHKTVDEWWEWYCYYIHWYTVVLPRVTRDDDFVAFQQGWGIK